MRKLAVLAFQTLDGVMQSPTMPEEDPSGGFSKGGWAAPYWGEVMEQVGKVAMAEPYDMLFGRKTYDAFAAHWPNVKDDPAADMMNAARKHVVTSSPSDLSWQNSFAVEGGAATGVQKLKDEEGPLLQTHGSAQLVQALFENNLVDEIRLWTFPVLVGSGKRLFESEPKHSTFSLSQSDHASNGVTLNVYQRE